MSIVAICLMAMIAAMLGYLVGYRFGDDEGYRLGQDSVRDKLIADSERDDHEG